jgi:DNA-binding IclR family transcriptional regulator
MNAFESSGDLLRLRDVVKRTGLAKGVCFRLLYTLQLCGFAEKVDQHRYRLLFETKGIEGSSYRS